MIIISHCDSLKLIQLLKLNWYAKKKKYFKELLCSREYQASSLTTVFK